MSIPRFTRLTDPGSGTMEPWPPIEARHVASGTPEQRGRMVLDESLTGCSAGIWECSAWTGTMGPYSVHEFMVVLDGSIMIDEPDGRSTRFDPGACFVIPKGLVCSWRQSGPVRKFFTILDDPSGTATPPVAAGAAHVIRVDPAVALAATSGPDPALVIGDRMPAWAEHITHADTTGQWSVGIWSSTPYQRKVTSFPRHELMYFLEGEVTLSHGDGTSETFRAGDTVFVPRGALLGWHSTVPVRKIFSIMDPR